MLSSVNTFGEDPITVTAADAVNITIGNGGVSLTATQGSTVASGLPSLTTIQQAISTLNEANTGLPPSSAYEGSLTLVKLPSHEIGAGGENFITFGTFGSDNNWALVLPQDTISVTMSDTQSAG